jgi:hypothetical protein
MLRIWLNLYTNELILKKKTDFKKFKVIFLHVANLSFERYAKSYFESLIQINESEP